MNKKLYKLMNWPEIEGVLYADTDRPGEILGVHSVKEGQLIQCCFKGAQKVTFRDLAKNTETVMEQVDEAGFFALLVPSDQFASTDKETPVYEYDVNYPNGQNLICGDPYIYDSSLNEDFNSRFLAGVCVDAYKYLGAHLQTRAGVTGTFFAVWAPDAARVSVIGDFNQWEESAHLMQKDTDSGIFWLFIPGVKEGAHYLYSIKTRGTILKKKDPYGYDAQGEDDLTKQEASVVWDPQAHTWHDREWMANRKNDWMELPVSIGEIEPLDFLEQDNFTAGSVEKIISYVKEMHYTHIQLSMYAYYMPMRDWKEAPFLLQLIDGLHAQQIGVLFNYYPAGFQSDEYGLSGFDGTCLYEHEDPRQGRNFHNQTYLYQYGRNEVRDYLFSALCFLAEECHADGICMRALGSMLYLDFDKNEGEWLPNIYGGNENLDAIAFLQDANKLLDKRYPKLVRIAAVAAVWPDVTRPLKDGGLGFQWKWNDDFCTNFFSFMKQDPYARPDHYEDLTYSMVYQYCENHIIPFSRKRMQGEIPDFLHSIPEDSSAFDANWKLALAYQMFHSGKKLTYLKPTAPGQRESGESLMVKDLNQLYQEQLSLYKMEQDPAGFQWINCIAASDSMIVFTRNASQEKNFILVVANFSGLEKQVQCGVPMEGVYQEIFSSEDKKYGGQGVTAKQKILTIKEECDDREQKIELLIPAYCLRAFSYRTYTKQELDQKKLDQATREKEKLEEQLALRLQEKDAIIKRQQEELAVKEQEINSLHVALDQAEKLVDSEQTKLKRSKKKL
ncbi:MAG: alpha amylase C-terminal domain-containing protein [Lachnospiraceae bacterium]|nr:alpha amylase C-terminal domain-containing protein [Lachnospiraceae bacterium]